MKIGIFTDSFTPRTDGIAVCVQHLYDELKQLGHDVYVVCPRRKGTVASGNIFQVLSIDAVVYEGLKLGMPKMEAGLAKKLDALQLDIIHIHTPLLVGLYGFEYAKKRKIKTVVSCHTDVDLAEEYPMLSITMPLLAYEVNRIINGPYYALKELRGLHGSSRPELAKKSLGTLHNNVDATIMLSQKLHSSLERHQKNAQVVVIPNGVADIHTVSGARGRVCKKHMIDTSKLLIITTSRPVVEKRLHLVIEALSELEHENVHLLLLGDGPLLGDLKKLAARLGVLDMVTFVGAVPHSEVFTYLSSADIYVNASMREVASLSIMEAAMAGLPLLLFDGRLEEPLEDRVNGYVVGSVADLVRRIQELNTESDIRNKMATASRDRAKNYTIAKQVENTVKLYQSLL